MAIMLPSVISPEVKSSAERRIFDWFRDAPGTDDWIVLHSLGISTHNKVIYGETDFFVLIPNMGIFALEVKGGRVRREDGIWYFTDKHGRTNSKVRGPFDQAKDGIFSIISAMKKRLNSNHKYLSGIFFGFGVMFPDIDYSASGIDEEQWQVFDARDGQNVKNYMWRLFSGAREKWEQLYGQLNAEKLPTANDIRYLASILRGDFDCAVSISAQLRNADDSLIALTKEQYRCLDQLDDNARCLIHGPAGTGKTLLAIEEVKKSVARGEKVALFCYNTNLADWLNYYFSDMPSSLRPEYVGTLHSYMAKIVRHTGNIVCPPKNSDALQDYYERTLPATAAKCLLTSEIEQFDKIVVDEAQDIIKTSYLDVFDACLKKGIIRGRWTMFGDFSMQAIYSGGISGKEMLDLLEDYTSFIRFKLTVNCRNTKPICEEIQTITGFEAPADLWTKTDGPPVNYITYSSTDDQRAKLLELLDSLKTMHIDPDKITVLSPRKRENSVIADLGEDRIADYAAGKENGVDFCTIQGFKGLENTVIVLVDIEEFSSDKIMYVGLSRARSGLYILESENAAKEYQSLLLRRLQNGR